MSKTKREIPRDWFCCPKCRGGLSFQGDTASCSCGNFSWNKEHGFWDFYPPELLQPADHDWKTWDHLQKNSDVAHAAAPDQNLGVGKRADFLRFGAFCKFHGNILDVGCGPQRLPTHVQFSLPEDCFFVGIDPLVGEQPRDFAFVRGLGEYLPFRNELFDQVLFVTSMDHFIDPRIALREATRVLKRNGEICVWFGEKDPKTPTRPDSPDWYKQLTKPEGCEDLFHFKRLTQQSFEGFLPELELVVKELHLIQLDRWRKSLEYKLVRKTDLA